MTGSRSRRNEPAPASRDDRHGTVFIAWADIRARRIYVRPEWNPVPHWAGDHTDDRYPRLPER